MLSLSIKFNAAGLYRKFRYQRWSPISSACFFGVVTSWRSYHCFAVYRPSAVGPSCALCLQIHFTPATCCLGRNCSQAPSPCLSSWNAMQLVLEHSLHKCCSCPTIGYACFTVDPPVSYSPAHAHGPHLLRHLLPSVWVFSDLITRFMNSCFYFLNEIKYR